MSKFAGAPTIRPSGPIETMPDVRVATHQGGVGYARTAKSDLFLLAVANLVGEDTFYETGKDRDDRYADLVRAVTAEDPAFVAALVPWLRNVQNLRSVAVVTACEYVRAGGPHGRAVIDSACARADEPAEILGYWRSRYGRTLPAAVKRGVADAATRLYTERSMLRYDGGDRPYRFGDVVEITHPRPDAPWRSDLFRHAIDRRHHRGDTPETLTALAADARLRALPEQERRAAIGGDDWTAAGWSWERVAGWLPGGFDADVWAALIPTMGYMALLRNLRRFDQDGVPDDVAAQVGDRLADPAEVAAGRQFPFRYYTAYREVPSMRWAYPLERALDLSVSRVPALRGRTLILLDVSQSMNNRISGRTVRTRLDIAAVFAVALAKRAAAAGVPGTSADLVLFSDWSAAVDYSPPLLRVLDGIRQVRMGGTYTFEALQRHYDAHDRIVVLTDEQAADAGRYPIPDGPTIYTWDCSGYAPAHLDAARGRYTFGGMSDACFRMFEPIERGRDADWPHLG